MHGVRLWWFEWGGGQVLRGVREWSLVPLFPLSTYSFTVGACMDSRDRLLHGMGTDDQVWTCTCGGHGVRRGGQGLTRASTRAHEPLTDHRSWTWSEARRTRIYSYLYLSTWARCGGGACEHGVRGCGQVLRGVSEWSLVPLFPLSEHMSL